MIDRLFKWLGYVPYSVYRHLKQEYVTVKMERDFLVAANEPADEGEIWIFNRSEVR